LPQLKRMAARANKKSRMVTLIFIRIIFIQLANLQQFKLILNNTGINF